MYLRKEWFPENIFLHVLVLCRGGVLLPALCQTEMLLPQMHKLFQHNERRISEGQSLFGGGGETPSARNSYPNRFREHFSGQVMRYMTENKFPDRLVKSCNPVFAGRIHAVSEG